MGWIDLATVEHLHDVQPWNELLRAANERLSVVYPHQPTLFNGTQLDPATWPPAWNSVSQSTGNRVQTNTLIWEIQQAVTELLPSRFLQHIDPATGSEIDYDGWDVPSLPRFIQQGSGYELPKMPTWTDQSLWSYVYSAAGIDRPRRYTVHPGDGGTPLYGYATLGDIIGPWLIEDLRRAFELLIRGYHTYGYANGYLQWTGDYPPDGALTHNFGRRYYNWEPEYSGPGAFIFSAAEAKSDAEANYAVMDRDPAWDYEGTPRAVSTLSTDPYTYDPSQTVYSADLRRATPRTVWAQIDLNGDSHPQVPADFFGEFLAEGDDALDPANDWPLTEFDGEGVCDGYRHKLKHLATEALDASITSGWFAGFRLGPATSTLPPRWPAPPPLGSSAYRGWRAGSVHMVVRYDEAGGFEFYGQ
jgi:hypothetical protein